MSITVEEFKQVFEQCKKEANEAERSFFNTTNNSCQYGKIDGQWRRLQSQEDVDACEYLVYFYQNYSSRPAWFEDNSGTFILQKQPSGDFKREYLEGDFVKDGHVRYLGTEIKVGDRRQASSGEFFVIRDFTVKGSEKGNKNLSVVVRFENEGVILSTVLCLDAVISDSKPV